MLDHCVLHLTTFPKLHGPNRSMLTLVGSQAKHGRVCVFALTEGVVTEMAKAAGAEVITAFGAGPLPSVRWRRWWGITRGLIRAVRERGVKLIHCHAAVSVRYALPAARWCGVPVVVHQRDNYERSYYHLGLGWSDQIIAISNSVKNSLPQGMQAKTTVVYNAVEVPDIELDAAGNRNGLLRVGTAGRCTADKGQDLLIEAALSLMGELAFEVHIWGVSRSDEKDAYAESLRRRISASPTPFHSRFFLEPFRTDIESFYRMIDIMVIPSRFVEPFGRTAIEAMSWGRPVAVAGHGGLVEIVCDGQTGLVFKPNDWRDLADKLRRLITDKLLRERLARAARDEVKARFSAEQHAAALEKIYNKLIDRRSEMSG